MRNLGEYIIPQLFESSTIEYYHENVIQNISALSILNDLSNEINIVDDLELDRYIEFRSKNNSYTLSGHINNSKFIRIFWNENGKFLRIEE